MDLFSFRAADTVAQETSRRMNAVDQIVVSDGIEIGRDDPWRNTRVLRSAEVQYEIEALKRARAPIS